MIATLDRPPNEAPAEQPTQRRPLPIKVTKLSVVASVALTTVTITVAISLCRVYPGWRFLGPLLIIALALHGLGLWTRWRRWTLIPSFVVSVGLLAVLLGVLFYRDSLFLMLPTRTTWNLAWRDLADSVSQFSSAIPPVPSAAGFGLAGAIGVGVTALSSDILAFRAYGRAEAIVPGLLLFVVGSSLGYNRNRIMVTLLWLMAVVVVLAFLRALHSESSRPWLSTKHGHSAARSIAAAAVPFALIAVPIGLFAGAHLPGSTSKAILDPHHSRNNGTTLISPMVDVKARLTSASDVEMFTVKTDHPVYLALTSLSDFTGDEWKDEAKFEDAAALDGSADIDGTPSTATITINHLGAQYVPAPYEPVQVARNADQFTYAPSSSTLLYRAPNLVQSLQIEVQSVLPNFTPDQLRKAPLGATPDPKYLKLPVNFPQSFVAQAQAITATGKTAFDKALLLQNWFRDNFRYDVNVPDDKGSTRGMQSFLNSRAGFCQQFAATYGAFARAVGLPTRLVVGFTKGDLDKNGVYHVKGKHAHTWPEVWLKGFGWVYFEPTPGRGDDGAQTYTGVVPQQAGNGIDTGTQGKDTGEAPKAPPISTALPNPNRDPDSTTPSTRNADPAPAPAVKAKPKTSSSDIGWWILAGFVALGLWIGLMPLAMPLIRRRWHQHQPAEYVGAHWHLAGIALSAVGFDYRPGETPVEQAARSAQSAGWGQHALTELAETATRAVYSPTPLTAEEIRHVEDLYHAIATAIRQRASWSVRIQARLNPRLALALF